MATCSLIFPPAALTTKGIVNLCFDFLPPFACLSFSAKTLSKRALKNSLACPCFKYFAMSTLWLIAKVFHSVGAEADLGLLQHHKELHLGCCSSPRTASEVFVSSETSPASRRIRRSSMA